MDVRQKQALCSQNAVSKQRCTPYNDMHFANSCFEMMERNLLSYKGALQHIASLFWQSTNWQATAWVVLRRRFSSALQLLTDYLLLQDLCRCVVPWKKNAKPILWFLSELPRNWCAVLRGRLHSQHDRFWLIRTFLKTDSMKLGGCPKDGNPNVS